MARHTAGTQLNAQGASLRTIMERLGHSDVKSSLRYQAGDVGNVDKLNSRKRQFCFLVFLIHESIDPPQFSIRNNGSKVVLYLISAGWTAILYRAFCYPLQRCWLSITSYHAIYYKA
jgi:hypothetical protein